MVLVFCTNRTIFGISQKNIMNGYYNNMPNQERKWIDHLEAFPSKENILDYIDQQWNRK